MDLLSFIQTVDPTKVRVGERQRAKDEPKLLDTTVGRVVSLLPVAPARASSQLEASVDKLFNEGGSVGQTEQGDSASGGHGVGIPQLREDHETSTGPSVAGKSMSELQRLLAGAVLNPKVRIVALPTLPFITSSVPSISLMTVATTITSTVDPATTVKDKFVESSVFGGDSSGDGANHTVVYVPRWSVTNGSRLDDGLTCYEMVDELAPPKFFASIRGMDHDQLFTEFNVGAARQMSLSAEVRMRAEYNIREGRRLNSVVEEKNSLLKAKDAEIKTLKAQLLVKEAEAAEAIRLRTKVSKFEVVEKSLRDELRLGSKKLLTWTLRLPLLSLRVTTFRVHELETSSAGLQEKATAYENCMGKLEELHDEQIIVMNDKFEKLYIDFIEIALHLEEKFYPRLLTTIVGCMWILTYGVKLDIVKCLHSPEYLVLTDIIAFNPSAERDYTSALQELQDVNFSLLAELKFNKDASTETLMNILRLDEPLAERLGLDDSQPHDNIANHRSTLHDVFVPLVEPLSSAVLEGTKGTSGTAPETTMALSVTFASTSSIPPISTDDYDVVHVDGQEGTGADGQTGAGADVNHFPNVEDAELDIS
ncbi:hypothetical protein Tco_0661015 [Tanacetum coccineum]